MEFDEALEEFDRLWFFSNVLSKSTPTQFRIPTSPDSYSDNGFIDVCQRIRSWLDDSVEAAIAATAEEDDEKKKKAAESECTKGLENLEQSTLIALLMSAPVNSIKPPAKNPDGDRGRGKGEKSKRKVKVKKELFERKRSVFGEVQSGYVWQLQKCGIRPEPNQVWETRFGAKKGYVF